jgi:hypothetical protein
MANWIQVLLYSKSFLSLKIKLKEANKIEEDKRKKELVNTVLKELKLR